MKAASCTTSVRQVTERSKVTWSRLVRYGLYGSTSCCISQWPSQWDGQISTPTAPKPFNRFWWNSNIRTIIWRPPTTQNFISIQWRGLSRRISLPSLPLLGFCLCLSFFFGLFVTRTGRTGGLILTIYTSYDVILPKDVPFFVVIPPHLGGQIPKKNNSGGVNRRFQA